MGAEDELDAALAAADALAAEGRADAALDAYDAAIGRYDVAAPDRRRAKRIMYALIARSQLLIELGRHEEALASCEAVIAYERRRPAARSERKARRRRTTVAYAHLNRGWLLRRLGRHDEALRAYDAVLAVDELLGDDVVAEAHHDRTLALGEQGRRAEAIAACDAGLARLEGLTGRGVRVAAAGMMYNKGYQLGVLGRGAEADSTWAALAADFGASVVPEIRVVVVRGLVGRIGVLMRDGRMAEALAACDDVLARHGADDDVLADVLFARGSRASALVHLGRVEEAEDEVHAALLRHGDDGDPEVAGAVADLLAVYGGGLMHAGDPGRAVVVLESFLDRVAALPSYDDAPAVVLARFRRATLLARLDRAAEALEAWDALAGSLEGSADPALRPTHALALLGRAHALAVLDRGDEAAATMEALADAFAHDVTDVFDRLVADLGERADGVAVAERLALRAREAWILGRAGRREEAAERLERALARAAAEGPPEPGVAVAAARELLQALREDDGELPAVL
jgi:tetratricopeptide (TPR) repeat protein